jgi:acetyltransferase-like isoleucine patch superfamily enzyme
MKSALVNVLLPLAQLQHSCARWQRLWAFCQLQARLVQRLDRSIVVMGCPELHGSSNIRLGQGMLLYRHIYLETQDVGSIDIGAEVVISRGVHIVSYASVSIGRGSMIGEFASIRDANHKPAKLHSLRESGHQATPITIGQQVWIGRGVTVLPGVHIGDRAVIGANAVVTHDVAEGSVVAGVPARPITSRPHLLEAV